MRSDPHAAHWELERDRAMALLSPAQRERVARGEMRTAEQRWLAGELLTRFDPDQPRDDDGKWTSGGGGGGGGEAPTAFVSPNVSNLSFNQAVSALGSKGQANLRQAGEFIDGKLGIQASNHSAIGAWADGAENSMMIVAPGATSEQMRAASAMKGYLADQKSVLLFEPQKNGDAFMASFDVSGKLEDVHTKLLNGGLAFHTLEPLGGDTIRVHVYGSDQEAIDAIDKAAKDAQANVRVVQGRGEFLGTAKDSGSDREQRDDARRVYEETIQQISSAGTLAGRDVGKVWNEARDYWQSLSAAKALGLFFREGLYCRLLRALTKFDPNQPRDPDGKWSSDGGGAGAAEKPAAAKPIAPPNAKPVRQTGNNARGADKRVSTAVPTAAKLGYDPHGRQDLAANYDTFKGAMKNPKMREGVGKLMERYSKTGAGGKNGYPPFLRLPPNATPEQAAEAFVEHAKSNIIALYNAQDPALRERSKRWYEGANKITGDLAKEYGVSEPAVAGVIATLSPQRDWDQNVDLAKRMLDVAVKNKDVPFAGAAATAMKAEMTAYQDKAKEELAEAKAELPTLTDKAEIQAAQRVIRNREDTIKTMDELSATFEGKSLSQLPQDLQPFAARFASVAQDPPSRGYEVWNPEGTPSGKIERNKDDSPKRVGWGGFDQIGDALSVLRDDSNANISASLGENHKVRNFYNNIISPDYGTDATIDTHAVSASMLMPLGQSSPLVKEGLGMSGPKNAATGLKGLYALQHEAYRRAAEEISKIEDRQVFPREMQSASWEALRGLYSDLEKRDKDIRAGAAAVWTRYHKGEIDLAAAQKAILAKGIRPPRWAQ